MTTILYVLLAVLLLGFLVVAHEFGHFITARMTGIAVQEFSVGFGPRLGGWTSIKTGTKYSFRLIPMGGYCAYYGEDDAEGRHIDEPRAYSRQPVWKRILSVAMGPGMNFIVAFVTLTLFFWIGGAGVYETYVSEVVQDGPAWAAGLAAGDRIVAVEGADVSGADLNELTEAIGSHTGKGTITLEILRGEERLTLEMEPFFDEALQRYRVGVGLGLREQKVKGEDGELHAYRLPILLTDAMSASWYNCVNAGKLILESLRDMMTSGQGLAGPVGTVSMISSEVRKGGFERFLELLVVISINLGVFNLLPIPGLDGSRLLFMLLEAVRRKPIPPQKEAMVHLSGLVLVFGLFVVLTFKDVINLFR